MWSASGQRIRREAKRRLAQYCWIDPATFAGALAAMMVALMPTVVPSVIHDGPRTELVGSSNSEPVPGALREDALHILVADDGKVYFGNREVEPESISEAIREGVRQGAPRTVYLSIDGRARFGDINPVLDQIQASGVRDVVLLAQPFSH